MTDKDSAAWERHRTDVDEKIAQAPRASDEMKQRVEVDGMGKPGTGRAVEHKAPPSVDEVGVNDV